MPRISQTDKGHRARGIVAGLRKRLEPGTTYRIGGRKYTRDQLVAVFQQQIDALLAIDAARGELAAAVARERALASEVESLAAHLKMWMTTVHGPDPTLLGDFGWALPRKRGPKTAAAKAEGVRKAKATRAARKTTGTR